MKYQDLQIGDWFTYGGFHFIKVKDGFGKVYAVSISIATFGITAPYILPNDEVKFCSSIHYAEKGYAVEDEYADIYESVNFVGIFDKQRLPFSIHDGNNLKVKYKQGGIVWEVTFCGENQGYSKMVNTIPQNDYYFYHVFQRDFPENA